MENSFIKSGPKNLNVVQSRAIVFNSKNEILLVSKNGERWSLPGGTVNKHHPLDKLATDEIFEETGLRAQVKSMAYYLQEKWNVDGFWNFNERIEYPFTAYCLVFAYHCEIIGDEKIDKNWRDLDHDIIKFKRFFGEDEFKKLGSNVAQDEIVGIDFEKIKSMQNQNLFI